MENIEGKPNEGYIEESKKEDTLTNDEYVKSLTRLGLILNLLWSYFVLVRINAVSHSIFKLFFKRCPKCQRTKLVSSFYSNRTQYDGLSPYCKPCTKLYMADWKVRHPGKRGGNNEGGNGEGGTERPRRRGKLVKKVMKWAIHWLFREPK